MTRRLSSLLLAGSLLIAMAGVAGATVPVPKIKEATARATAIKAAREKFGLHGLNIRTSLPEGMGRAMQGEVPVKLTLTPKPNVKFAVAPPKGASARINVTKTSVSPKGTDRVKNLRLRH